MGDALSGVTTFRGIDALAERCGHYGWTESRLFQLTGKWSAAPYDANPEITVHLSAMSARHAFIAAQWADRLPVRAGVDRAALVGPPPGPLAEVLARLDEAPSPMVGLAGLVTVVLPRVLAGYADHRGESSPVSEAPVRAVLDAAILSIDRQLAAGEGLLASAQQSQEIVTISSQFCQQIERPFEGSRSIFPSARAS